MQNIKTMLYKLFSRNTGVECGNCFEMIKGQMFDEGYDVVCSDCHQHHFKLGSAAEQVMTHAESVK